MSAYGLGMSKPRLKKAEIKFPYRFEKNGRTGRIKFWPASGIYATHFTYASKACRNTFKTFEAAWSYLDNEFSKLDDDKANALSLHPLAGDVKNYHELECLLREKGGGATLRDAVTFFLANHKRTKLEPKTFVECEAVFLKHQKNNNISSIQLRTLEKHYRRFKKDFGTRKIDEITTLEITDWLATRTDEKSGRPWSAKTKASVLGSLVSLSLFAQEILKAIPDTGKTEFQKVRRPKKDAKEKVEIYTAAAIETLLLTAIEHDIDLIPAIVVGCFEGLRPFEFHAEGADRPPLTWEEINWTDQFLHVTGQKVRSKATRDIPLHDVTVAWLKPFAKLKGPMWTYKQAYTKKMNALREKAEVQSIYDGFRHSYASYRVRQLKGNLSQLAEEMGNSPAEIVDSYKRNVSDEEADAWFSRMPPAGYGEKITAILASRRQEPQDGKELVQP